MDGARMSKPVCNRDCFNCIYEDCIDDGVSTEEYLSSQITDKRHGLLQDAEHQKCRERYRQNREKKIAASKAYYQSHKEQARDYLRKYRASHREVTNARQRAWYAKHREEILAKARTPEAREKTNQRQRERRLRKREEAKRADTGQSTGTV